MKTDDKGSSQKLWSSSSGDNDLGKGQVKMESNGQMQVVNTATQAILYKSTLPSDGSNFYLIMQNDGNLVTYDDKASPKWATNTVQKERL